MLGELWGGTTTDACGFIRVARLQIETDESGGFWGPQVPKITISLL